MKQYDIFISYRRSSYDTANLIATRLRSVGYSVFFDMETLRAGKFNVQLYEVIEHCKDFIVVLPPEALDRCENEDDWVRMEVCHAMKHNKNIIPIMLNGFKWPEPMPVGMEELCNYQALTANSVEYFDLAMERLQRQYLLSKRHIPLRKIAKLSGLILASVLALVAIVWGVLMFISKDVCQMYATRLTSDTSAVHILAQENEDLLKVWRDYQTNMRYEYDEEDRTMLGEQALARVDLAERNVNTLWCVEEYEPVGDYHRMLLSLRGVETENVDMSPSIANSFKEDFLHTLELARKAVADPTIINIGFVEMYLESSSYSYNGYYAAYLNVISRFPESSRTAYNQLHTTWTSFPLYYDIDRGEQYYLDLIDAENNKGTECIDAYQTIVEKENAELDEIIYQQEAMEHELNDRLDNVVTTMDSVAMAQLAQVQRDNGYEIAMHRERIEMKAAQVDATRAELEEMDRQYVDVYESLKAKCAIEEGDDQWYKWGKIIRWGKSLAMMVESRRELREQGIYSTSAITPEVAYADMNSMLSVYQTYHPESAEYVTAAKLFYKELSKGEREYAGVIVFAFKDDAEHDFFRKGDIVVKYAGVKIKTYNDFKNAFQNTKDGVVDFIRVENGGFVQHSHTLVNSDIVGFLELTE